MARIVLTVGGYVLGNMLLPGMGGAIGGMLGGYVGGMVDQQLFGGTAKQTVYGARMQDLRVQSSSYGSVIPTLYGKGRLAANVIWMRGFDEEIRTETQTVGGGGARAAEAAAGEARPSPTSPTTITPISPSASAPVRSPPCAAPSPTAMSWRATRSAKCGSIAGTRRKRPTR